MIGNDPTRYKTLVPWLVDEEASNRYPAITEMSNRQVTITPSGVQSSDDDAKNDPSDLNDPAYKKLSAGKSSADGPNPYLSHIPALDLDKGDRSGEQTVVETPKGESVVPGQENWTTFEKWLLTALRKKSLTEKQREYFNLIGFYIPEGSTTTLERPTVNEAWDKWPSFQQHVAEKIVPAIKTKNMFNIRGFNNWLNSPETWKRYMEWREDHDEDDEPERHAAKKEDGRGVDWPDGGYSWVPYSQDLNEAYQEYLRGKEQE